MKILSRPRGNAEEYGRWSVNPYKGCPHGCAYCYLKKGAWAKGLGGDMPQMKAHVKDDNHAFHIAMCEIIEHCDEIIRDGGLFMTFTSDPCLPETSRLFLSIAMSCAHYKIPVTLLTKCGINTNFGEPFADPDEEGKSLQWTLLSQLILLNRDLTAIGFTLTGHDELEPNAPTNDERIKLMKRLADGAEYGTNMKTWASIEPVIDFPSSLRMIEQALDAGCQHFKIGLLTNNTRVCRDKYDLQQCLCFVQDVMQATADRATVYWKQSVREFIGGTTKHRLFNDDELADILDRYPHSVSKDWSIFDKV